MGIGDTIRDAAKSRLWRTKHWWQRALVWVCGGIAASVGYVLLEQVVWSVVETWTTQGSIAIQSVVSTLSANLSSTLSGESLLYNDVTILVVGGGGALLTYAAKSHRNDGFWKWWGLLPVLVACTLYGLDIQLLPSWKNLVVLVGLAAGGVWFFLSQSD